MKRVLSLLAVLIFTCAFASIAQAQATRTWVSGVGDDANPCSRTAPCKTWAGAISKTADCGEIDALDPGGFGAVTITKSITLDGTGTLASILGAGTNGVNVNDSASGAANTHVVTLRGISINGACTGLIGINFTSAKELNIEDCVIFRFSQQGVRVANTANATINIRNSVIRDNVGDGALISTTVGQVKGTFVNSSFTGNGNGIHAQANARLVVDHCNMSGGTSNGVLADGATTGVVRVTHSLIANNTSNGVNGATTGVVEINDC